jgi:prepilin-type N-terminal cleavage/methylation domain-containing protein
MPRRPERPQGTDSFGLRHSAPAGGRTTLFHELKKQRAEAFSLLEILAVLSILSILALLLIPNYSRIVAAAQEAICASHMRSIRIALGGYLDDHERIWPQPPPEAEGADLRKFWFATLKPYDIGTNTWQCPTIRHALRAEGASDDFGMHYVPTQFDATPNIANRWATQPWLIEAANAHGKGPLICFPDGSVKSMFKVLAEQGAR